MRLYLVFLFIVPILNIVLNTFARRTAIEANSFLEAILSVNFAITFAVGMASVLAMISLYRSGVALPRAIIFMGAISIVGGAIWGFFHANLRPNFLEVVLIAVITMLMLVRFVGIGK